MGFISYRAKVKKKYARAVNKALTIAGAHMRNSVRKSLKAKNKKNGKDASRPGEPPKVASANSPLRRFIRYYVDRDGKTVTIGVELWHQGNRSLSGLTKVAKRLEYGGQSIVMGWDERPRIRFFKNPNKKTYFDMPLLWHRAKQSQRFQEWCRQKKYKRVKMIRVEARPFMRPALERYIRNNSWKQDLEKAMRTTK